MMKRFIPISVLTLFLAVPGSAEINDELHVRVPQNWLVSEDTLTARLAGTEMSLSERVARLETTMNERMARVEGQLTERVARMERTLNGRVAALKREVSDLRASVQAAERQTRGEGGEKATGEKTRTEPLEKKGKPAPQTSRWGEDSLNTLRQRTAEIDKALTELGAQVKDLRGTGQFRVRAAEARGIER